MTTVKLCRECKHSMPEPNSEWNLRCLHPAVNAKDPWALATNTESYGSHARAEREKPFFFGKCGMRGALWEKK